MHIADEGQSRGVDFGSIWVKIPKLQFVDANGRRKHTVLEHANLTELENLIRWNVEYINH